eukprot:TRINITY_DN5287_c0_g1_i1.p1 TRINITY_DN5287_c0_g1~~TRINITY_DN5287_c0_g1_i1.p1  ORF type:complete len:103 (-),score=12.83 TRINITY_DN5287_c0_g1_i1:522-830(-)
MFECPSTTAGLLLVEKMTYLIKLLNSYLMLEWFGNTIIVAVDLLSWPYFKSLKPTSKQIALSRLDRCGMTCSNWELLVRFCSLSNMERSSIREAWRIFAERD